MKCSTAIGIIRKSTYLIKGRIIPRPWGARPRGLGRRLHNPPLGGGGGGSFFCKISVNISRITDLPPPKSPPKRGLSNFIPVCEDLDMKNHEIAALFERIANVWNSKGKIPSVLILTARPLR